MPYLIEDKEVVILGDTTTHGGRVVTGSTNHTFMGIPVARVGDMVECPKCKGTYPIIEGAPRAFDHDRPIARHGDKVACGATLISQSNANMLSGAFFRDSSPPPAESPYSAAELCAKVAEVRADENVRKALEEARRLTLETGYEWGGWIVETAPGVYDLRLRTDKSEYYVYHEDAPDNAVANFHTHNGYGAPYFSFHDRETAHKRAGMFDIMINDHGQINVQDRAAKELVCDEKKGGPRLVPYN